jgi:hypothetical protein
MANENLTAAELTKWKEGVGHAIKGLGDPSRSITYRAVSDCTFTGSSGQLNETGASTTLQATRMEFRTKKGAEGVEGGQVGYLIAVADLTAAGVTEPSRQDRLVDGADTYEVADYAPDPTGAFWTVFVSKVATP